MTMLQLHAPTTPATEQPMPEVRVCAVRPTPPDRRARVVLVRVVAEPVVLVLGVAQPRGSRLQVRVPVAEDGGPAIGATPELWARVEQAALAAVQADPAARTHLFVPRRHMDQH